MIWVEILQYENSSRIGIRVKSRKKAVLNTFETASFFLLTNFLPLSRSYGAQTSILVNDYKLFAPTELDKKTI